MQDKPIPQAVLNEAERIGTTVTNFLGVYEGFDIWNTLSIQSEDVDENEIVIASGLPTVILTNGVECNSLSGDESLTIICALDTTA